MDAGGPPSLRERRRLELREQLSDTATTMFLERGFDAVTVADVARACGVTEKTVYNHYRTKEALLVDRWPSIIATVTGLVRDPARTPVAAVTQTLETELDALTLGGRADADHLSLVRRFGDMVDATEALRDLRLRSFDQLVRGLHAALAERGGRRTADAELLMTAVTLSGLFHVFYRSVAHHVAEPHVTAATCRRKVRADVRRAARSIPPGLGG